LDVAVFKKAKKGSSTSSGSSKGV